MRLFVERARSARADFVLTPENVRAVAETCQRLDGLPLAIELAAARVRLLSPQTMLQQMDERRLKFLVSPARDLPKRQRTLRDAIAWSYDLLSPAEQSLFRQLAVFMGGASLEAIQSVCQAGDPMDLLDELESLLDQNLVRQAGQEGQARISMLETIRDFADEMLVASGEAPDMQAHHLAYFHDLARRAKPELVGPDELTWITRLGDEHENLRAAVQWGLRNDVQKTVELLADLGLFWSRAGQNEEVIGWLRLALSSPSLSASGTTSPEAQNLRGRALFLLGLLTLQHEYPNALATLPRSRPRAARYGQYGGPGLHAGVRRLPGRPGGGPGERGSGPHDRGQVDPGGQPGLAEPGAAGCRRGPGTCPPVCGRRRGAVTADRKCVGGGPLRVQPGTAGGGGRGMGRGPCPPG